MSDSKYNGWTNYATWRVSLEMFDGLDPKEYFRSKPEMHVFMVWCEDYANEMIEIDTNSGFALDYARAFISDVNWREIAEHLIDRVYE